MRMYTDATTAKVFAMGTAMRSRLKHIDQRQQWVQLTRDTRVVEVRYGKGATNKADIQTKVFFKHPKKYETQRDAIQVRVPATDFSKGSN